MSPEIIEKYGNRLRVRVCGLCWKEDFLLVANHKLSEKGDFWAPIGGGIEFNESAQKALIREFMEEAKLKIEPGKFQFACEFIDNPLHAIELFFQATSISENPALGFDPESSSDNQILKDVKFMEFQTLKALEPDKRHGIFQHVQSSADLKNLTGFYRI